MDRGTTQVCQPEPDSAAPTAGGPDRRSGLPVWLRYAPVVLIVAACAAVFFSGLWRHLSLDDLEARRDGLRTFVGGHPVGSVALYVGIYCAVVALSLPGALIMTLTGGFLFGTWLGGAAGVVGVSTGATLMFLVARTSVGDLIRRHIRPDGAVGRLEAEIRRHAFSYLLTIRLIPAAPLWIVNIAAGLVRMPVGVYAAATVLGVMPSTFIYASIGAGLNRVFLSGRRPDIGIVLHPEVLGPLFALAALSAGSMIYMRWRGRRAR